MGAVRPLCRFHHRLSGYSKDIDTDRLQELNDYATGGLWSERTLLLDPPVEQGLQRVRTHNGREGLRRS